MKIIDMTPNTKVRYSELKPGDVFRHEGKYYMKLDTILTPYPIDLSSYRPGLGPYGQEVELVEAELVITHKGRS